MKDNSPKPIFNQGKEAYSFYNLDCNTWYEAVYHLFLIDNTEQQLAETDMIMDGVKKPDARATREEVLKRQPAYLLLPDEEFDRFVGVHECG